MKKFKDMYMLNRFLFGFLLSMFYILSMVALSFLPNYFAMPLALLATFTFAYIADTTVSEGFAFLSLLLTGIFLFLIDKFIFPIKIIHLFLALLT